MDAAACIDASQCDVRIAPKLASNVCTLVVGGVSTLVVGVVHPPWWLVVHPPWWLVVHSLHNPTARVSHFTTRQHIPHILKFARVVLPSCVQTSAARECPALWRMDPCVQTFVQNPSESCGVYQQHAIHVRTREPCISSSKHATTARQLLITCQQQHHSSCW